MSQPLPTELVSLIHHLHLNEAGWWDKGIRQLIVSIVWLNGTMRPDAVSRSLQDQYSITLETGEVRKHLQILSSAGILVAMPDGNLKIAETELKNLELSLKRAEDEADEVRQVFQRLLQTHCPSLDVPSTWLRFNEDLLLPLIHEMGAKTFEMISGTRHQLEETTTFPSFLEKFASDIQDPLRTTIIEFLNPRNLSVRSYVLNNLNTYFFLEAGNMNQNSIAALLHIAETGHSLKLFLDTNIIFSILGFHNNPSNEAVQSLLKIVKQLSDKIEIQFYVLPITVSETKRGLDVRKLDLANVKFSPNIASVAAELEELSGASRRFAEACSKAGRALTTEEYFGPYLNNLLTILRAHGVELYNDPQLNSYSTRQEVIDDILLTQQYEENRFGDRAKGYDKIAHDMILWHFVSHLRNPPVEAPFQAEEWIVTIDYRLLGFDEHKQSQDTFRMPACLHPSGLIQMFQFWVPRSAEFEKALITGFQLPFLFREFDSDAENVTIRILQTIAHYENIENIPRETIGHIILNQALRDRIRVEEEKTKQIDLVKEAFLEVNIKLTQELAASKNKQAAIERENLTIALASEEKLGSLERTVNSLQDELGNTRRQTEIREGKFRDWVKDQERRAETNAQLAVNAVTVLLVVALATAVYFLLEPVFDNWGWIEPIAWLSSIGISVGLFLLGVKLEPWNVRSQIKATIRARLVRKYVGPLSAFDVQAPPLPPSDDEIS
jgi:hypothetical protein